MAHIIQIEELTENPSNTLIECIIASATTTEKGRKRLLIISTINKRNKIKTHFKVNQSLFPEPHINKIETNQTFKRLTWAIKAYNEINI